MSTPGPVVAKRRMRFVHARELAKVDGKPVREWPHAICTVTAVSPYAVHYRNETGFRSYTTPERFPTLVLQVLDDNRGRKVSGDG